MTDLKPCPICGRKLSWEDVAELDDEGYITHYFVDVATVLLNCDCGFNMMISADLIDYPMAGWEDRFKERVNKRVDMPKKMCANCKYCEKREIELSATPYYYCTHAKYKGYKLGDNICLSWECEE